MPLAKVSTCERGWGVGSLKNNPCQLSQRCSPFQNHRALKWPKGEAWWTQRNTQTCLNGKLACARPGRRATQHVGTAGTLVRCDADNTGTTLEEIMMRAKLVCPARGKSDTTILHIYYSSEKGHRTFLDNRFSHAACIFLLIDFDEKRIKHILTQINSQLTGFVSFTVLAFSSWIAKDLAMMKKTTLAGLGMQAKSLFRLKKQTSNMNASQELFLCECVSAHLLC